MVGGWLPRSHFRSSRWTELCLIPTAVFELPNTHILRMGCDLCKLVDPLVADLARSRAGRPGIHLRQLPRNPSRDWGFGAGEAAGTPAHWPSGGLA
jgi:hypothetical protein